MELRPEWRHLPFAFIVPGYDDNDLITVQKNETEDHNCFDRTLTAFCAAYGVIPASIRYMISYPLEDSPRFELLSPARSQPSEYSALELLAVFRSLRYNESFHSISFSRIRLDILNDLIDPHGVEYVLIPSQYGPNLKAVFNDPASTSLLVQEIRALAVSSSQLRRLDVSYCFPAPSTSEYSLSPPIPSVFGILEALTPLCKGQSTGVDWLVLNGVKIHGRDMEKLLDLVSDKRCRFRALEVKQCGMNEDATEIFMDAIRAQSKTLEAIDISQNKLRIDTSSWARLLSPHRALRKLDLSGLSTSSSSEPLLALPLLAGWKLEQLRLAGLELNQASVDALSQSVHRDSVRACTDP